MLKGRIAVAAGRSVVADICASLMFGDGTNTDPLRRLSHPSKTLVFALVP